MYPVDHSFLQSGSARWGTDRCRVRASLLFSMSAPLCSSFARYSAPQVRNGTSGATLAFPLPSNCTGVGVAQVSCAGYSSETARSAAAAATKMHIDPQVCATATASSLRQLQLFSGSWVCLKLCADGQGVEKTTPEYNVLTGLDPDSCVIAQVVMVRRLAGGRSPCRSNCERADGPASVHSDTGADLQAQTQPPTMWLSPAAMRRLGGSPVPCQRNNNAHSDHVGEFVRVYVWHLSLPPQPPLRAGIPRATAVTVSRVYDRGAAHNVATNSATAAISADALAAHFDAAAGKAATDGTGRDTTASANLSPSTPLLTK